MNEMLKLHMLYNCWQKIWLCSGGKRPAKSRARSTKFWNV